MLPYRLRAPIFGTPRENRKRKTDGTRDEVTRGGGPVQVAITKDLQAFQQSFLDHIHQEERHDPATLTKSGHWKSGRAFQMFKDRFGSARIALLHLLVPYPRCDREAYSQIIYAACLDIFRTAMNADSDKFLEAQVSLCTLYTLYETNPLFKAEEISPEEHFPNGLYSRENSRSLYRRAFRQPIRIDTEHFSLVMELREQCRLRIDQCQRERLESSSPSCTCGIARDTIAVIDRLSLHWDFCEYTGPVGLEAMAGHPDYPYRDVSSLTHKVVQKARSKTKKEAPSSSDQVAAETTRVQPPQNRSPNVTGHPSNSEISEDLANMMNQYQKSIQSIHLGTTKTKLATQLRKTLEPVLPESGKVPWSEKASLIGTLSKRETTGVPRYPQAQNQRLEESKQHLHLDQDHLHGGTSSRTEGEGAPNHDNLTSHRLVLPENISTGLQHQLQNAFDELVQRGTVFPSEAPYVNKGEAQVEGGDQVSLVNDVSTLGVSGISNENGQGRNALQSLLSTAAGTAGVPARVGASNKKRANQVAAQGNRQTTSFLEMEAYQEEEDDVDDVSHISNLSDESELDEGYGDETSAATSAVGKQALHILLDKVSKGHEEEKRKPQKRSKTRRRKRVLPTSDQSVASSVEAGGAALDNLLQQAKIVHSNGGDRLDGESQATANGPANGSARKQPRKRTSQSAIQPQQGPQKKVAYTADTTRTDDSIYSASNDGDERSFTSSVGPGAMALSALMKQTDSEKISARNTSRRRTAAQQPTHRHQPLAESIVENKYMSSDDEGESIEANEYPHACRTDNDELSIVSSAGPGATALGTLMKKVDSAGQQSQKSPGGMVRPQLKKMQDLPQFKDKTTGRQRPDTASESAEGKTRVEKNHGRKTRASAKARKASRGNESSVEEESVHDSGPAEDVKEAVVEGDESSTVATSVGPGEAALGALLTRARNPLRKARKK